MLERLCYYSEFGETPERKNICLKLFKKGINSPTTDLTADDDFRQGIADSLGYGCKDALDLLLKRYTNVLNWEDRKGCSVSARLGK